MENGFILLWRKIEYWDWYYDIPTHYLWLHILRHARHQPGFCNGTPLNAGQLVIGRKQIVEKLKKVGMTDQKFKTCMKRLVEGGEITTEPTTKGTIVTVTNWELYQKPLKKSTTKSTIQQPTGNHPATTNNNDNNDTMKDVVGSSISSTLLQAVVDVWENPSKSLVSGVEKLAEEHGEALVIEALKTAVEHDTEGGVSLAYVKAILSNLQIQQEQPIEPQKPRTRKEIYTVVVNGVEHERIREVPI